MKLGEFGTKGKERGPTIVNDKVHDSYEGRRAFGKQNLSFGLAKDMTVNSKRSLEKGANMTEDYELKQKTEI